MRVGEERGVGNGFCAVVLIELHAKTWRPQVTYSIVWPCPLPSPQVFHLLGLELMQREHRDAPLVTCGRDILRLVACEGRVHGLELVSSSVLDGVGKHSVAALLLLDPLLVPDA